MGTYVRLVGRAVDFPSHHEQHATPADAVRVSLAVARLSPAVCPVCPRAAHLADAGAVDAIVGDADVRLDCGEGKVARLRFALAHAVEEGRLARRGLAHAPEHDLHA